MNGLEHDQVYPKNIWQINSVQIGQIIVRISFILAYVCPPNKRTYVSSETD